MKRTSKRYDRKVRLKVEVFLLKMAQGFLGSTKKSQHDLQSQVVILIQLKMSYYFIYSQQSGQTSLPLSSYNTLEPFNVVFTGYPSPVPMQFQMESWPVENHIFSQQTVPPPLLVAPQQQEPPTGPILPETRNRKQRKQCVQKELESAKKNSESNLINQLLAFLNNPLQSLGLVILVIKKLGRDGPAEQKVKAIFYNVVRLMNYKRGRKYVNRLSILRFYTPESFMEELPHIQEKCEETGVLSLEQLCWLFRVITFQFIRAHSINAALTSKRISSVAKPDHLRRRRKVQSSLVNEDQE